MTLIEEITEALAELEHEQWMHWSKSFGDDEIHPERRARWQLMQIPYEDLPEVHKELDRVWARRVIDLLDGRGLLNGVE